MVFYRSFTDSISYPLDGNRTYWLSLKGGCGLRRKFARIYAQSDVPARRNHDE